MKAAFLLIGAAAFIASFDIDPWLAIPVSILVGAAIADFLQFAQKDVDEDQMN